MILTTIDNISEPPRKNKKVDAAAVDFWASFGTCIMSTTRNGSLKHHPSLLISGGPRLCIKTVDTVPRAGPDEFSLLAVLA